MGSHGRACLLWLWVWAPLAAAQFGGGGFGGGYGGWTPPPPQCKPFSCPAKQKPIRREDVKAYSYGCKDSGLSILSGFNPNDPLGGLKKAAVPFNKCCVEKDVCHLTCGMVAATCHNSFQKCVQKSCKGDQNCHMQAQLADITSGEETEEERKMNVTPDERACFGFNRKQKLSCECVPADKWQSLTEKRLASFFKQYNPSKLDSEGNIKDTKAIWKTWKGKESEMFLELTKKYKDKAVEMREKPKKPGDNFEDIFRKGPEKEDAGSADAKDEPQEPQEPQEPEAAETAEDVEFSKKMKDLEARKEKAKEAEDYDLAGELKEELLGLKRGEVKRLKAAKSAAIAEEDFIKAKQIKSKIKALDPKDEL